MILRENQFAIKEANFRRTGLISFQGETFFYKMNCKKVIKNEFLAIEQLNHIYPSPQIIEVFFNSSVGILLFDKIDAQLICGYNQLRDESVSLKDRIKQVNYFYERYNNVLCKNLERRLILKYPASIFFEGRIQGRLSDFYRCNEGLSNYKNISMAIDYLKNSTTIGMESLFSFTHGDLHDINFSYDWFFWDFEAGGFNPVLSDIACLLWYCLFKEDSTLPVTKPEFIKDNTGGKPVMLNEKIYDVRIDCLLRVLDHVENAFVQLGCTTYRKELCIRLLCRVLLIEPVNRFPDKILEKLDVICSYLLLYDRNSRYSTSNLILDISGISKEAH